MIRGARLSLAVAVLAIAFACGAGAANAKFEAHGSVEQVYATNLQPHARVALLNADGKKVRQRRANRFGALLWRNVKPGKGYRVRLTESGASFGPITVLT